jgi:hypothetical protein
VTAGVDGTVLDLIDVGMPPMLGAKTQSGKAARAAARAPPLMLKRS